MNKITAILPLIQGRYECDENIARAILGTRMNWDQSLIQLLQTKPSLSLGIMERLEEAEGFFEESSDEILCCPYIPAGDTVIQYFQSSIANLAGKVAVYETRWAIEACVKRLRKRFELKDGKLFFKESGKPVRDSGKYVLIYPQDASKKIWKQRRAISWPVKKGDDLFPSYGRIVNLLSDERYWLEQWFEEYKVDYYGREFSGMVADKDNKNVRVVLPVHIQSARNGLNEDIRVWGTWSPFVSAPLIASYASWIYKTAGYIGPNKELTDIRPDNKMVEYLANAVKWAADSLQEKIDEVSDIGRRFRKS